MEQPRSVALTGIDTYFGRRLIERLSTRSSVKLIGLDSRVRARPSSRLQVHRIDSTQPARAVASAGGFRWGRLQASGRANSRRRSAIPMPR